MAVSVVRTAKISKGSLNLQDLQELMEATKDFPRTARVQITASHDVREGSYYTLVVTE